MSINKKISIVVIILVILIVVDLLVYFLVIKKDIGLVPLQNINIAVGQANTQPVFEPSAALAGNFYSEQAFREKSFAPCFEIEEEMVRVRCVNDINKFLADQSEDAGYCLTQNTPKNQLDCVKRYALENNQVDQCELLGAESLIDRCQEYFVLNNILKKDITLCDLLDSGEQKTFCQDQIYFLQGQCQNISNEDTKNQCLDPVNNPT